MQQTIYPLLKVEKTTIKYAGRTAIFYDCEQVNLIYNHDGTELTIEIK